MTTEADEGAPKPAAAPPASAAPPAPPSAFPLDASGRERPHFLLDFPDDPALQLLVRAFERGNYAFVRVAAPQLIRDSADPAVQHAARELRRRIDPDPLMKYLLWAAVALFVFMVFYTYQSHSH